MKTINLTGSPDPYLKLLIDSGMEHKLICTNSSTTIELPDKKILFTDKELTPFELGFIGRAKKEVIEASERLRIPEKDPIFYRIFPHKFCEIKYLTEVDLSTAFWSIAYREGLLSQRIFQAGETVTKSARLIAFGAAATVKRAFYFDGKEYTNLTEEKSEPGRRAYFYVASKITSYLREICEEIPGEAKLYWVDAIVCTPPYSPYVCRRLAKKSWAFTTKVLQNCRHFQISPPTGPRVWEVTEQKTGRTKEFKEYAKKANFSVLEAVNKFLKK